MLTPSQKAEFIRLLRRYQRQSASPREIEFLENYYRYFDKEDEESLNLTPAEKTLLENRIYQNIGRIIDNTAQPAPVIKGRFSSLRKLVAAAAIIILIVGSMLVYFLRNGESKNHPEKIQGTSARYKNDLEPGSNKAILILSNGSKVFLDSVRNGDIGTQGSSKILKFRNGALAYQTQIAAPAENAISEIEYNTVSTPKGGQYQIELADGTKVWLNAASSIRFPTAFRDNERQVELTGEAYFEVATRYRPVTGGKGTEKIPFYVNVHGLQVQVLGTHFNINAYDDEASVKTTLLEGAVKVVKGNDFTLLKPGNQSEVDRDGKMKFIAASNVDEAVAWKNGVFEFRSAGIETIMRQIARWYDVDVEYQKKVSEHFYAEIPRNTHASELFKILEATGAVHFEIEGRKVKVLP
jgi:hypothetical protein